MLNSEDFEPESTQECVACHKRKPLWDFDFDGQTENGRRYRCIECDDNQQPLPKDEPYDAVPDEAKNLDELLAEDAADEEE